MKLSVHLVTWNGAKYILGLFESLRRQTFRDWQLLILDNHSTDETADLLKKEMNNFSVQTKIIESEKNLGFAGGHNQLISNIQYPISNYVLVLNQDIVLEPDYFEKLVNFMDKHPEAGAVTGRLMRMDERDIIDSLGLKVFRSRRVVDWMEGKNWKEINNLPIFQSFNLSIFGVSGAAPIYRCQALEQVGFFDPDFFSYKEDVDLAFRLRRADWKAFVLFDAVAYHDRSASSPDNQSTLSFFLNRQKKSETIKYYSYRNHLLTLFKNEHGRDFWRDFIFIFWYELKKAVYLLFFEPRTLFKSWIDIFCLWHKIRNATRIHGFYADIADNADKIKSA